MAGSVNRGWGTHRERTADDERPCHPRPAHCVPHDLVACGIEQIGTVAVDTLQRPLLLALSYDEEVGCFGAPRLVADLCANVPRPAAAIVGEPTEMRIVAAHKGAFIQRTTFTGRAAHS